jgi:drug/metabolite transporter (DMT)-like permease
VARALDNRGTLEDELLELISEKESESDNEHANKRSQSAKCKCISKLIPSKKTLLISAGALSIPI